MSEPRVSVIVTFYKDERHLQECVKKCLALDYHNFEVIVAAKTVPRQLDERAKLILAQSESQAVKKDVAINESKAEICAFIDDDAYPRRDWLRNAVKYFDDPEVGAVCGPGITPVGDSTLQKAGGTVYSSVLGSGLLRFRYHSGKRKIVREFPGFNVLIRKVSIIRAGLFATSLRSGEDSLMSEKLSQLGIRILYVPEVVCYHHRRPLFGPHLRQVFNYGYHRGFFSRHSIGPSQTSSLVASILLVSLMIGLAVSLSWAPIVAGVLITGIGLACLFSCLTVEHNLKIASLAAFAIPLTHLAYSSGFFAGMLSRDIGERPSH